METFTSFIAGEWLDRGELRRRENPARPYETAAAWRAATPNDVTHAARAAAVALPCWAAIPLAQRATRLHELLARVERHADDFAALITRENGKTLKEAMAEIRSGLADARAVLATALTGVVEPHPGTASVRSELVLEPLGVCALITPWNFPLATILRKLVPALVYGNTALVKPSELTPGPAVRLFQVLADLNLPPGTASLLLGEGATLGPVLASQPQVRAISFTGSQSAGLGIARALAARDVRLQLEMGGKNSLLVLEPADLDAAVAAAAIGGFSCAGQWCTGTGRVIVEATLHDAFVDKLLAHIAPLRVGPGDDATTDLGPLVSAARVGSAEFAVAGALAAGASLRCGGHALPGGHYYAPTVLTGVSETMDAFAQELFVPVLPIVRARNADDAVRLANLGAFGLAASVFCSDVARGEHVARQLEAGIVHVNLHTAYREAQLPVCAWRESGRGSPEGGRFARDFYTRPRALYVQQ